MTKPSKRDWSKEIAKLAGEPNHLVMLMMSITVNPDELSSLISHIREEAVEEERKRIRETLTPSADKLLPLMEVVDRWWRLHQEMGGEVVWQDRTIYEDMPRQMPVKVIYYTPLQTFHEASGLSALKPKEEA